MTFSIVARCQASGMFGVAVCSSSPAVAARCAFARAGVGAATSQNITDPALGERLLDLMAEGHGARAAMAALVQAEPNIDFRQMIAVDRHGEAAVFSGARTLGVHATAFSPEAAAAGNLLANEDVPGAMVRAFDGAAGVLGERLLVAMRAAIAAGGEAGPVHSAGLKIVDKLSWPLIDLRVDWAEAGVIDQLQAVWRLYAPQAGDYVARAVNPGAAPGFGVPGDP